MEMPRSRKRRNRKARGAGVQFQKDVANDAKRVAKEVDERLKDTGVDARKVIVGADLSRKAGKTAAKKIASLAVSKALKAAGVASKARKAEIHRLFQDAAEKRVSGRDVDRRMEETLPGNKGEIFRETYNHEFRRLYEAARDKARKVGRRN